MKLKKKNQFSYKKYLCVCLLLLLSRSSLAVDFSYYFDSTFEDSSNLSQLVSGEEGQAKSLGFGFDLSSESLKEWDFDISGEFEYTEFSQDSLQNEKNKNLQASGFYNPTSNNFAFVALIDISQIPINRFQTQEVNNIQDQNAYALKPSYFINLSSTDKINLEYTIVDFNLEDIPGTQLIQNTSNVTNGVLINYEKQINETNSLSLNFASGDTDFDGPLISGAIDYEQTDVFLRWIVIGNTNQIQIDIGNSKIEDELSRKFDVLQKSLLFTRQINQTNSITLNYTDGFSNALNTNQSLNTIAINQQNNLTTAQSVEDFSFNHIMNNSLLSTNIGVSTSTINQVGTQNIEETESINFSATYQLSKFFDDFPQSDFQFFYVKSNSEFETVLSNLLSNELEDIGLRFNFVYSSNLTFSAEYSVIEISQVDLNLVNQSFDSKSFLIQFTYSDRGKF